MRALLELAASLLMKGATLVVPALDLLQLEVLIGDEVQRALLELEPDDALRGVCTREREGDVDEQKEREERLCDPEESSTGIMAVKGEREERRAPAPSPGRRRARCCRRGRSPVSPWCPLVP